MSNEEKNFDEYLEELGSKYEPLDEIAGGRQYTAEEALKVCEKDLPKLSKPMQKNWDKLVKQTKALVEAGIKVEEIAKKNGIKVECFDDETRELLKSLKNDEVLVFLGK